MLTLQTAPAADPVGQPAVPDAALWWQLAQVLERSTDLVVQTDARGAITYLNPAARAVLGLSAAEPVGHLSFSDFATPATQQLFAQVVFPALNDQGVWVGETAFHLGAQRDVPFSHMAIAHRDAQGRLSRFSAVMRNIADQVHARRQIQRQTDILRAITEAIPATVVIVDSQGRYRFVNSAFERYSGRAAEQILGHTAVDVLGADEVARRKPFMQQAFAGGAVDFTLDYPGPEGCTWLRLSCIPLKLDGVVDGFVGISQDVTAQHREQERLTHLAERDPLTGLLNRAGFEQGVERKVWAGEGPTLALLYIDLDHFKPVNDLHGHLTGDGLLQQFAQRLGEAVRGSDLVARLGGDEFAILLSGIKDEAAAQAVARKVLTAARQPFAVQGRQLQVSASVGVALANEADHSWRELLARADAMMYRAKAAGRGRLVGGRVGGPVAASVNARVDHKVA